MILCIMGITCALIIAGAINNLSEQIDQAELHWSIKVLLKIIVWVTGIASTILLAAFVALLSSSSKKSHK